MTMQASPGWFADPFARFEHRYWDGSRWTEHVGSGGQQSLDAPVNTPPASSGRGQHIIAQTVLPSATAPVNKRVQRQVENLGVADRTRSGGGTLLTEPILVVNQKAKLFEKKAEYEVFDQLGRKMGGVRQFGTSMSRVAVGRDNATKRLQIVDAQGMPLFTLTRPATVLKSKVIVMRGDGTHIGQIVQENTGVLGSVLGGRFNIRFRLEAEGVSLGTVNAESWQAWDFSLQDPHGSEFARITKTWAGLGRQSYTKADNYVLEIHRHLEEPLISLVVCAALAIDTVLHQGSNR